MPQAGPAAPPAARRRASPARSQAWVWALAAACLLLTSLTALPQGGATQAARPKAPAASRKSAKIASTTAMPKAASPRHKLSDQAKGLALASAITEAISAAQLDIAARVLTGQADCELRQTVRVQAVPGKPGLFIVEHQGKRFVMAPRETSTGAVRLEDPTAGVVWLQIPAKSMLMNARIGQRMVDSCLHAEQRGALLAAADPLQTLGIEVRAAAPAEIPATPAATPAAAAAAAPAASAGVAEPAVALPPADAASAPANPSGCTPAAQAPTLPPVAPAAAPVTEAGASSAAPAAPAAPAAQAAQAASC